MKKLYFLLPLLLPLWGWGTTTSGATTRAVLIDGVVSTGAAPGANGVDWETDEVFQGFQGAVNWYLTWDDNNLYLGRIGGNNAEGSVLYIRADYPGATFATPAFDYDQLLPDVSPMGGVNFAAYLKNSYNEFRTYNGAWSAATANTLTPQFSTQGNGANMELTNHHRRKWPPRQHPLGAVPSGARRHRLPARICLWRVALGHGQCRRRAKRRRERRCADFLAAARGLRRR
jgi:hypothetical protein